MTANTFFTTQKCNHTIDINMTEIMQHCDINKLNYLSHSSNKRRYLAFKQPYIFSFSYIMTFNSGSTPVYALLYCSVKM